MTDVIHLERPDNLHSIHDEKNEFKNEIEAGLSKVQKQIPSKYFYDNEGCELFNKITRHPDYYLTRAEIEILTLYKDKIAALVGQEAFNLVELGPGEGIKSQILMTEFQKNALDFTYMPIDISSQYLRFIMTQMNQAAPSIKLTPIHSDYFQGLEWLSKHSSRKNVVLFLGSSIGNLDAIETNQFLQQLWSVLNHGDYVLMGFDLRKDINVLMRAYNDSDGLTKEFNLNLLRRINRELDANFNLNTFRHYATYNVYSGAMESYLISLEKQRVEVKALNKWVTFEAIEPIHVEYSHKYSLAQIQQFAHMHGFKTLDHFMDYQHYFVDALWQVDKQTKR